ALDSGAYLTALRRTRVGDIRVEDCVKLEDFQEWLEEVRSEE
ncbi:MAG: tRNA pseudouridine(55) synthase, partial [Prevotella sp.]|nr:tRNA pseudouridine(55) synthase [Prevotella sp.]